MAWFLADEWTFAEKAAELVTTNPFDPAWRKKERDLLGTATTGPDDVYAWKPGWGLWGPRSVDSNELALVGDQIDAVAKAVRQRLHAGETGSVRELEVYEVLAMYRLYAAYGEK